jgi:hypothetical protein
VVEQPAVNRLVAGSNPARGATANQAVRRKFRGTDAAQIAVVTTFVTTTRRFHRKAKRTGRLPFARPQPKTCEFPRSRLSGLISTAPDVCSSAAREALPTGGGRLSPHVPVSAHARQYRGTRLGIGSRWLADCTGSHRHPGATAASLKFYRWRLSWFALRRQRSQVRILSGAPIKSITYLNRPKAREAQTHHRLTRESGHIGGRSTAPLSH